MLEHVAAAADRAPHDLLLVDVAVDGDAGRTRHGLDRPHVLLGRADPRLDHVDPRVDQHSGPLRRLFRRAVEDPEFVGQKVPGVARDPGSAHEESGARDFVAVDPVAEGEARHRRREIDPRGHARREQLPGGRLVDEVVIPLEPREPLAVVAVPENHDVDVRVDHPRHHRLAPGVDDFRVRRNLDLGRGSDRDDPVPLDHDRRVVDRGHLVPVEKLAAHQRDRPVLGRGGRNGDENGEGGECESSGQRGGSTGRKHHVLLCHARAGR